MSSEITARTFDALYATLKIERVCLSRTSRQMHSKYPEAIYLGFRLRLFVPLRVMQPINELRCSRQYPALTLRMKGH